MLIIILFNPEIILTSEAQNLLQKWEQEELEHVCVMNVAFNRSRMLSAQRLSVRLKDEPRQTQSTYFNEENVSYDPEKVKAKDRWPYRDNYKLHVFILFFFY